MPKFKELINLPPEPEGGAEEQLAALRDYLVKIIQELQYLLSHLEPDNINDDVFQQIYRKIPQPYGGLPLMDGAASSGGSGNWARGDHRHPSDAAKADAAALAAVADDLEDTDAALAAHVTNTGNPHEVTKAQVGLGNVADERQYSAQNPPPLPTPADIGAATAQDLTDHVGDTANPHSVTAAQVGARPDTWTPSKSDIGLGNVANERQYSAQNPPPIPDAEDVPYDNTQSALTATDVQAAIDEIAQGGGGGGIDYLTVVNGQICVVYEVTP